MPYVRFIRHVMAKCSFCGGIISSGIVGLILRCSSWNNNVEISSRQLILWALESEKR